MSDRTPIDAEVLHRCAPLDDMHLFRRLLLAASVFCSIAAAAPTTNPSFDITVADATRQLADAARTPKPLDRPLVILGGFLDLGVGPSYYAKHLKDYVRGDVLRIAFADCRDFEACRRRVVGRIDSACGSQSERETVEVDAIGQSMGGLVGLYAALDDPKLGKRVKIRRLFTISSPLQGANRAARMPAFLDDWPLVRDMRPGSALLARIAGAQTDVEVVSYSLLGDPVVGERLASLPGRGVWWLDGSPIGNVHAGADFDPRIMLDIVRRLRGEPPIAVDPPAPLPTTLPTTRPTEK